MLQRDPIQKFHGDESLTAVLANVVNRADVGMIEGGSGLGFALKAGERLLVAGNIIGQEFEGYEAVQARVFRFVHNSHAAATEFLNDVVVRDGFADHWGS